MTLAKYLRIMFLGFLIIAMQISIGCGTDEVHSISRNDHTDRRRLLHGMKHKDKFVDRELAAIDCSASCSIPTTTAITSSNLVGTVSLTASFVFSFDFQPVGTNPTLSNIIDIVSNSLGSSLLSVSLEPQSMQVAVFYLGQKVLDYGPGASPTGFTTFTVSITSTSVVVSNGAYSVSSTQKISPVLSEINSLYISGAGPAASGSVKNVQISGFIRIQCYSLFIS
jgi:hypothetical protein